MDNKKHHTIDSILTFKKDLKRHSLMSVIFFVLYCMAVSGGGLLFFYIEDCYDVTAPKLDAYTQKYFDLCHVIEAKIKNEGNRTDGRLRNSTDSTLMETLRVTCEEDQKQRQLSAPTCKWNRATFYKWVEYSYTICYTIGYGKIVTRSQTGRLVTILYAIPAIGITMAMNIFVGNVFIDITKIILIVVHTKLLKQSNVHHLSIKVFCNQVLLALVFLFVYSYQSLNMLFRGAKLSRIDAIYFSFITFSTIGFGDINIDLAEYQRRVNTFENAISTLTVIIGLAVVASALSGFSQLLTEKKKQRKELKTDDNDIVNIV